MTLQKLIQQKQEVRKRAIFGNFTNTESAQQGAELEKAKYFKREGSPGNYKYYYTEEEYKKAKGKESADDSFSDYSDSELSSLINNLSSGSKGVEPNTTKLANAKKEFSKRMEKKKGLVSTDDKHSVSRQEENSKPRSTEDDQRINLIEKLIKQGFSPEEAKQRVGPASTKGPKTTGEIRAQIREKIKAFSDSELLQRYEKHKSSDVIDQERWMLANDEFAREVQERGLEVPTRKDKFDVKVGDTVGNTVSGFNFELLGISSGTHPLEVKDKRSGKVFNTTRENMYLSSSDFKIK